MTQTDREFGIREGSTWRDIEVKVWEGSIELSSKDKSTHVIKYTLKLIILMSRQGNDEMTHVKQQHEPRSFCVR